MIDKVEKKNMVSEIEVQRIQKVLSHAGFCSRREAEKLLVNGQVSCEGRTLKLGDKVAADAPVRVDGHLVRKLEYRYYMLHKPDKCLTSRKNDAGLMNIFDLDEVKALGSISLASAGRLDFRSTGLLILTNDGTLVNRLTHPKHKVEKTYRVRLDRWISDEMLEHLNTVGALVDGMRLPLSIQKKSGLIYIISIRSGANRIVRRLIESIGLRVLDLQRIRMGTLKLDTNLSAGNVRSLSKREIYALTQSGSLPTSSDSSSSANLASKNSRRVNGRR